MYTALMRTAVVVIDMQDEFLTRAGMFRKPVDGRRLSARISVLLRAARTAGHSVVWVTSEYPLRDQAPPPLRPQRPAGERFRDVPMNSDWLAGGHAGRPCCAPGSDTRALYEPLRALQAEEDPRVIKHRYSAFGETDLADQLRRAGVERVVIAGVVTNVCVRATATDAFFCGFDVTVASDAVAATSPGLHREALAAIGGGIMRGSVR